MGSKPVIPINIKISIIKANLFPSSLPKNYTGDIKLKIIVKVGEMLDFFELTKELAYFKSQFSLENDKKPFTLTPKHEVNILFIFSIIIII